MKLFKIFTGILLFVFFVACKQKNSSKKVKQHFDKSLNIQELTGSYVWNFKVGITKQTATHTFYRDSIIFQMQGAVYSTLYTMIKIQYEQKPNKWIGRDDKNNFYAMFIKKDTDSEIYIYKKKCKTFKEAEDFKLPEMDDQKNHGWNIYQKK